MIPWISREPYLAVVTVCGLLLQTVATVCAGLLQCSVGAQLDDAPYLLHETSTSSSSSSHHHHHQYHHQYDRRIQHRRYEAY